MSTSTPRASRAARVAALLGLLVLELAIARTYLAFGTWWHWVLHQYIGWGVGLSTAAMVGALTRYRIPAVPSLVMGQLLSIVPDLMFRFMRDPHKQSMDVWVGHISIHTGPSPVLVAIGALLLGGWAWIAMTYTRRLPAVGLALTTLVLIGGAVATARNVPTRLQDFPLDTPRVVTDRESVLPNR